MYRKIVWCYVFVLTLLDISLNTKLSAQGKSHGVTVHDSLIEGITFQEWGKESAAGGAGGAARGGAVLLSPPALDFGRAALAAAHALTVTLTNTANSTMHLASVAGTTPDFHASFFESKSRVRCDVDNARYTFAGAPPSGLCAARSIVRAAIRAPSALALGRAVLLQINRTQPWSVQRVVSASALAVTRALAVSRFKQRQPRVGLIVFRTLPPQANTTFSVVYLGRREGPVSAHLYIHTSLGVHKYPVSALGVASEWGVWPLVGVRVPLNASVEPLLAMHNPTDHTIQVSEVYSSGAWLGLVLPGGGESAPRTVWSIPPRTTRPLVHLRLSPPPAHHPHPLTAYVRIKANMTGGAGGGLLLCVEARGAPAGEHVSPLQLRLRTRGSRDPPDVFDIAAGNSAPVAVALQAGVWAARCAATPPAPPPPPPDPPAAPPTANGQTDKGTANGNGVKSDGVYVTLLQPKLEPHQQLTRTAQLTLDYAKMWAGYVGGGRGGGAWCAGWLRVGGAALPYSLRLLPGTLRLAPPAAHFVTANRDDALRVREVRVRNEFPVAVHIARIDLGDDVDKHFEVESLCPLVVGGGDGGVVARVRLRDASPPDLRVRTHLTLRTNLTDYTMPLLAYSGKLQIEWEWPNSADGELRLGAVGTSSTRRVGALLHNTAPTTLCVTEHTLDLPGAQLALEACAHLRAPPKHACRCIGPGERASAWLTVVAPAREGALRGAVSLWAAPPLGEAPPALTRAPVALAAHRGRVLAHPLLLHRAAPYAWSSAPLVLESSMSLQMRVIDVVLPASDPAVFYEAPSDPLSNEVTPGKHTIGSVVYAAEKLCEPDCYTGLDITTTEGAAWLQRAAGVSAGALALDAALQRARHAAYRAAPPARRVALLVHTSAAVRLPAAGAVRAWWPRLAPPRADAPLAAVGAAAPLRLRARNPSRSHALLLQAALAPGAAPALGGEAAPAPAAAAAAAFALGEWRATRGAARAWAPEGGAPPAPGRHALPLLLLAPDAEVEIKLTFAPQEASTLTAYLYLRNNLTILEGVQLTGRGAYPSFELGGRRPGTNAPLVFEVSGCGGGTVRRTIVARNTGAVGVRLRDWRLAGQPCQARGFRLSPCAPLALAPNESRALTLAFTPDYTLARVACPLAARAGPARAAFLLAAAAPARLLPRCARAAPRPPWEPAARAAAALLALAAFALVLAAAALDAERGLRRARAARPPPAARRPLDLRALQAPAPAPPPPARAPPRRRRTPHARRAPAPDPLAERRAFERWRAELRRPDHDDDRSGEDAPPEPQPAPEPPACPDDYEADPDTEDRPAGSGDEDAASTGSGSASASSSSPTVDDRDEADEGDEPDRRPLLHEGPERSAGDESPPVCVPRADSTGPPVDVTPRPIRARRDTSETPRRGDRSRPTDSGDGGRESRSRPPAAKHHARKEKVSKRRSERPAASPPRASPVRVADARAPGALRWGASWSSVVAAGAGAGAGGALAPIGSDVRRRAEPERGAGDHSLFYFNGDAHAAPAPAPAPPAPPACRDADFSWRAAPPVERPAFTPARDFLEEPSAVGAVGTVGAVGAVGTVGAVGAGGAFRPLSSVWGSALEPRPAAAAWLWGAYEPPGAMRPPPGFGAAPRARPYDPFRSLASIWAPGARDALEPDEAPH